MHAEAGSGVDFADAAADLPVALGDVADQEIDAADVKADGGHRAHRHVAVVGMDHVGHVGRCLLYTSDAAAERSRVDLGGRRIIKKKK